jgi:hypothetical protein
MHDPPGRDSGVESHVLPALSLHHNTPVSPRTYSSGPQDRQPAVLSFICPGHHERQCLHSQQSFNFRLATMNQYRTAFLEVDFAVRICSKDASRSQLSINHCVTLRYIENISYTIIPGHEGHVHFSANRQKLVYTYIRSRYMLHICLYTNLSISFREVVTKIASHPLQLVIITSTWTEVSTFNAFK